MDTGKGTILYTFLLWINLEGAPEDIKTYLMDYGIKYRIGANPETSLNKENAHIRMSGKILTCTLRSSSEVKMLGCMKLLPFDIFHVSLKFNLSLFDFKIGNNGFKGRFLYHEH